MRGLNADTVDTQIRQYLSDLFGCAASVTRTRTLDPLIKSYRHFIPTR